MKVFISWSGDAAETFALFLHNWLKHVVQALKPFMSEQDIGKGSRNVVEMSKELEATEFGIVVVTRQNLGAPWINFEAGAISRSVANGRLAPLLLDVPKSEVVGPLSQFQAVDAADPLDVLRLFEEINRSLAEPLEADVLRASVGANMPALQDALRVFRESAGTTDHLDRRPDKDIIREVLLIVRDLQRRELTATPVPAVLPRANPGLPVGGGSPASETWQDDLKRLDAELAAGRLSAEEYRRLRDTLLTRLRDDLSGPAADRRDEEGHER